MGLVGTLNMETAEARRLYPLCKRCYLAFSLNKNFIDVFRVANFIMFFSSGLYLL